MTADRWLRYLRIRYAHLGRGWEAGDCWNLVRLFYQAELGIELRDFLDYTENWAEEGQHFLEDNPPAWGFVPAPGPALLGDVLMFRYRGLVYHCGIALDPFCFLHTHTSGTSISNLQAGAWARRLHARWRHQTRIQA